MKKIVFIFLILIKLNLNAQTAYEIYLFTTIPGFDVFLQTQSIKILNEKEKEYSFLTRSYININYVDSCKEQLKQIKGMKLKNLKYIDGIWFIKCNENKIALFDASYYDKNNKLITEKHKIIPKEIPYQDPNDGIPAKGLYDFFCSYMIPNYKNSKKNRLRLFSIL